MVTVVFYSPSLRVQSEGKAEPPEQRDWGGGSGLGKQGLRDVSEADLRDTNVGLEGD